MVIYLEGVGDYSAIREANNTLALEFLSRRIVESHLHVRRIAVITLFPGQGSIVTGKNISVTSRPISSLTGCVEPQLVTGHPGLRGANGGTDQLIDQLGRFLFALTI